MAKLGSFASYMRDSYPDQCDDWDGTWRCLSHWQSWEALPPTCRRSGFLSRPNLTTCRQDRI
ncbi:MAG: hypothetical protein IJR26_11390 [Bacteroidales bacterium]|nr:hypothetical protein [Bacteroidales bacterium]